MLHPMLYDDADHNHQDEVNNHSNVFFHHKVNNHSHCDADHHGDNHNHNVDDCNVHAVDSSSKGSNRIGSDGRTNSKPTVRNIRCSTDATDCMEDSDSKYSTGHRIGPGHPFLTIAVAAV